VAAEVHEQLGVGLGRAVEPQQLQQAGVELVVVEGMQIAVVGPVQKPEHTLGRAVLMLQERLDRRGHYVGEVVVPEPDRPQRGPSLLKRGR